MKTWFILVVVIGFVFGLDYSEIPVLKWAGHPGSKPDTYEEWIKKTSEQRSSF